MSDNLVLVCTEKIASLSTITIEHEKVKYKSQLGSQKLSPSLTQYSDLSPADSDIDPNNVLIAHATESLII